MTAIVSLQGGQLPAYLRNKTADASINDEVRTGGAGFPVMSIKGKVWTLVQDGERRILTKPDDPDEVVQSVEMVVLRANPNARVYYEGEFAEGTEGAEGAPDCYSNDGVRPGADAKHVPIDPNTGEKCINCQACPMAVWGSKRSRDGGESKGTACTVNTRASIVAPDDFEKNPDEIRPILLRIPAGSRANFNDIIKQADKRGIPYNALVLKASFDKEQAFPKLLFKITALLNDSAYETSKSLFTNDDVMGMVGMGPQRSAPAAQAPAPKPAPKPEVNDPGADLDALIGAKAEAPAPAPAPAPRAASSRPARAQPKPEAKPLADAQEAPTDMENLLGGLDSLLNTPDD